MHGQKYIKLSIRKFIFLVVIFDSVGNQSADIKSNNIRNIPTTNIKEITKNVRNNCTEMQILVMGTHTTSIRYASYLLRKSRGAPAQHSV